jgi:hypothetical protein
MKRALLLALLLAVAAVSGGVGRSQATFVAGSGHADQMFGAAAAFNGVSVSLADPGTALRASVPLSATASSDRPLVSVTLQRSPAGAGTWTTICAPTAAPYACSWNSTGVADGLYDLRATALDASGYSRTSSVPSRRVDNTAPSPTLTVPAAPLTGTRTVSATAADATGIASITFEARPSGGGAWTTICTDAVTPYSCSWNTASGADGDWDVRATATDGAGNTGSSTVSGRQVDNTAPTVSIVDDGTPRRGTATIAVSLSDGAGTGVASVLYQYRASGGGAWTDACSVNGAPFACNVDTTIVPDGLYDLRAVATDGVGLSTTSATVVARIDNTAPSTAAMTTPTGPISGTITLNGTGTDAVGMGSMRFEVRTASSGTWQTACTDTTPPSPFSCSWSSTTVADGSYEFRAIATDTAGNTRTSFTTSARVVDNNGPVVSVTGPAQARGTATVTTSVSDASGIQNVVIRYRASGGPTYTTICTDSIGPTYSCPWNTTSLADGAYELIAVATDTLGRSTTSSVSAVAVNNTGPTGTDIQGTNGGVNDRLDAGDTVRFTYSTTMSPASILPGWSGSPGTAIRVRVTENGSADNMTFYDASNTTPLSLLATGTNLTLRANYVSQSSVFNATIARSGSVITVTIGTLVSGAVRWSTSGTNAMTWQTNAAATDTSGRPVYATTVTESGSGDTDF